jgi:hypothetical protein
MKNGNMWLSIYLLNVQNKENSLNSAEMVHVKFSEKPIMLSLTSHHDPRNPQRPLPLRSKSYLNYYYGHHACSMTAIYFVCKVGSPGFLRNVSAPCFWSEFVSWCEVRGLEFYPPATNPGVRYQYLEQLKKFVFSFFSLRAASPRYR